jgi:hypothetical protein
MKALLLLAATLSALSAGASAAPAAIGQEARIGSASSLHIRDFRAEGRNAIYIQDRSRNWYRATFATPCFGLPFARSVAVDTRLSRNLDRFSTLLVRGQRCQLNSFIRIAAPPRKVKRGPLATHS